MSVAPPTAGVESAFSPAPVPTTAHTTSAASAAPTAVSTSVASLSPECAAKVSSVITDDLRQLSRDDLDVKRWLNTTLSRVLEAAKDVSDTPREVSGSNKVPAQSVARPSLPLEEQLVQLLHARVQSHSQELSAGIEDLISNTLVRLPRTTMELSRMSTEADELTAQLQSIETVVQPAVNARSDSYVTQLHIRKASEAKLRRCTQLLEKAARVAENIRNIQYLVEQREAKAASHASSANKDETPASATADLATKSADVKENLVTTATTTTRQRDLDEVAAIIRQAREDLKDITAVDDTFGEQYKAQLEQFEQYIEAALEEECVACLRAHQLERATRLITTLHSIGRADAVLKRYGEQAAATLVEQQEAKLRTAVAPNDNKDGSGGGRRRLPPAAAVAELLLREIIPDDSAFLSRELAFLSRLVRGAAAAATEETISANVASTRKSGPLRTVQHASASSSSTVPAAGADVSSASTRHSSASGAVEDDPCAAQVLDVLAVLLKKLHAPVQAALQPLLTERPDTTNKDIVACFTAIQQIKISASSGVTPTAASTVATTAKDPLEKLAREITHRALALFANLFQEEAVLERYADRVCTPVSAYCAQPLAKIFASSSPATNTSSSSKSSGASPSALSADDDSLARVLINAAQEVLVYVPEKVSARCTAAWHAQLSTTLAQQLKPTPNTSQHVLLQHLYLYKQRVKPLLVKTQQAVEDWLSSGAMHERYPTGAGLLRTDLQTRLWIPLKAEVEAAQRTTQLNILSGITRPILAKVEGYTRLPCWSNQGDGSGGSSSTGRPLGLYSQGQVAPSSAVRDMGEMLMELPLTLETLASAAVAESYHGAGNGGSATAAVIPPNDADAEEGVRLLIDEQAEEWLETVVHDVVRAFLDDKVLRLRVGPFADSQAQPPKEGHVSLPTAEVTGQLYVMALEQLTTDLDYLRNILSAVNEESQETVERVMSAIRALPAERQGVFVVGEALRMTTSASAAEEDALETPADSDTLHEEHSY
jgi:conserved oligomeric Golgi complex subunit 7